MAEIPHTYKGKALTYAWTYRSPEGELPGVVGRYDDSDGHKDVVPHFRPNGSGWLAGGPPEPSPLYGLEVLAADPDKPVWVVEGEKCASALQSVGFVAVTTQGGSSSARKADWSALEGRSKVYLLPDNDSPGFAYMQLVASALKDLDRPPEVLVVDLPNLPANGDVVDFWQTLCPEWDGYALIPESERDRLVGELRNAAKNARGIPPEWTSSGEDWPEPLPLPKPGEAGETPPFPVDLLPKALRSAAQEVARFVQVDVAAPP